MVEVILLGIAQDAGVPQAGCSCDRCLAAHRDPALKSRVVSLGLIDRMLKKYWIIDATPDFRDQLGFMLDRAPGYTFGGIFLTHLHMGHYTGLIHLGEEAADLKDIPLYCTETAGISLQNNAPWSGLFRRGNIEIRIIYPDQAITLSERLTLQPVEVPHRASAGKTLAFAIVGPGRQLFFCPDIDSWAAWGRDLYPLIASFDIALLDGTFFDIGELPGRNLSSIPHPFVIDTMDLLEGVNCEVLFVHLNHTNPLLRSGEARELAAVRGFQVGFEGQTWDLASAEPNT